MGESGSAAETAAPGFMRDPRWSGAPVPIPPAEDGGTRMAEDWPLQDFLELGALPGAVPSARLHARSILWEWGLIPLLTDAVEQVVSELVTNSVTAARVMPQIQPVRLWLRQGRLGAMRRDHRPARLCPRATTRET